MFDLSDPRIDGYGWIEEQAKRRKQRDEQRFEARLAGREPKPDPEDEFSSGLDRGDCPAFQAATA
jgi:hypothetical protein